METHLPLNMETAYEKKDEPKAEEPNIEEKKSIPEDIMKVSLNEPVDRRRQKTTAKRNKEKKSKILKRKEAELNREKEKLRSVDKIKEYMKDIEAEKEIFQERKRIKLEAEKEKLQRQKEGVVFGEKKIGRYKYEQLAVDFQLPQELPRKLAEIKVDEGSSIRNCFESIVKRGLVQPGAEERRRKKVKEKLKFKYKERPDAKL